MNFVVFHENAYAHMDKHEYIVLTSLCGVLSPYLTGLSRLTSTSEPGMRQFSHFKP